MPSLASAAVRRDEWLSEVLGRPAFAVAGEVGADDVAASGFYTAKVDAADTAAVARLERLGFGVVDVNVQLVHCGGEAAPAAGARVAPAEPGHAEALLDLAGRSFRWSRFHLDPELPGELADRVKREWVRSYLEGRRGLELLVALEGGRPAGFLAVLERSGARVIDLVAVAPERQGRGLGGTLVAAFLARHAAPGREALVGTQVANVPSLRLYARHGFVPASAAYVLHRHVP